MKFNPTKPIFLQICDIILDQILGNTLQNGDRLLSVRDMGENIRVNPNTVQRAYAELQQHGIIEQQRGIGYFISPNSKLLAKELRKEEFTKFQLPLLAHQMQTLELSWDDLRELQQNHLGKK